MKKKSQIAMLMIVGLLLFIVVSFVLYLTKTSIKRQSQLNIKKTQEVSFDTLPIKNFVTRCMDKLAKEAVILLGSQGGYIYKSQGGTLVDYVETDEGLFFINYNNFKVAYNILPPMLQVPIYPWGTFPYKPNKLNELSFEGYFGRNNMPPLYSALFSPQGPHSIQAQIESYIDNNIEDCLDLSAFKEQGLEITTKNSRTKVNIGDINIIASSDIPIIIINEATKETFRINTFSTTINVRLKKMYSVINEIIDNDVKNVKFDIKKFQNQDFNVNLLENVYSKDDIVIITDESSLIDGKQFQYIFARRNRAPALYYLRPDVLYFDMGHSIDRDDLLQGQQLEAEDPDEDSYDFKMEVLAFDRTLPKELNAQELKFQVNVSDGSLSDYQIITAKAK